MIKSFPENWQLLPLEDCMASIIDYRGKSPQKTASGIPLITAKIVKGGRIDKPEEFIAAEDYDEWMRRGLPELGDVVMTTEAPLGEVAQLDNQKVALAQRLITLRGKMNFLDNTYLKFLMQSDFIQEQLKARSTGTTVLGIRQSELRKVLLAIPPYAEQRAIAHILGTLDDKIELTRRMNETLEGIARVIFKSWFVNFDPVRAKIEGRDHSLPKHIADLFPESFEALKLDEIPVGWKVAAFTDTVEIIGGGTPKTSVQEYWNGNIPWFSVVDAPRDEDVFVIDTEKKITPAGVENSSTQMLAEGTTIISARGTVGTVALVGITMAMNQSCYGLLGKIGKYGFFTYFATHALVSTLRKRAHGSVFDTITRNTLAGVETIVPPPALVEAFEQTIAPFLKQIRSNLFQSTTIVAIRDALLPKLLSGEIRVKEAEKFIGRIV